MDYLEPFQNFKLVRRFHARRSKICPFFVHNNFRIMSFLFRNFFFSILFFSLIIFRKSWSTHINSSNARNPSNLTRADFAGQRMHFFLFSFFLLQFRKFMRMWGHVRCFPILRKTSKIAKRQFWKLGLCHSRLFQVENACRPSSQTGRQVTLGHELLIDS